MVDHLGCLAVLAKAGGCPDIAETLLVFRAGIIVRRVDEAVCTPAQFGLVLGEMMMVRESFEEATACMVTRN